MRWNGYQFKVLLLFFLLTHVIGLGSLEKIKLMGCKHFSWDLNTKKKLKLGNIWNLQL
jgi:hypothetical protein